MKRCYIAGKIGKLPDNVWRHNFEVAKLQVQSMGLIPVCPTDLPHTHDKSWQSHMREDLTALLTCNYLYAQHNWKDSRGATIEVNLARELGITIIEQTVNPDEVSESEYGFR